MQKKNNNNGNDCVPPTLLHLDTIPCAVRVEWDGSPLRPVHLYVNYHFLCLQRSPSAVKLKDVKTDLDSLKF